MLAKMKVSYEKKSKKEERKRRGKRVE